MKIRHVIFLGSLVTAAGGLPAQDFLDRVDERLTVSAAEDWFRFRLSGRLDLEEYRFSQPPPGLIYSEDSGLFNPRLTFFLDAQWGEHFYAFAQTRLDRGFDPRDGGAQFRVDEFAVRYSDGTGKFNVQLGKFATVVGNWVPRHGTWENPFVTAPLPYENLSGIWNTAPAGSGGQLLNWAHVRPNSSRELEYFEKPRRTPIIWGPSYAAGASVFGEIGKFTYAAEVKNGSLSSHPRTWDPGETQWQNPAFNGRVGYRPNEMWNLGFSAGTGTYLRDSAVAALPPGRELGDYRQDVLAQDISFAWHHLQVWAECFESRYANPEIGSAETVAYYTEVKYKFAPQFFAALRWNQQWYGTVTTAPGLEERWGRDTWRIDFAPTYRFSPHTQFKLQYSFQHEDNSTRPDANIFAAQFVLRF